MARSHNPRQQGFFDPPARPTPPAPVPAAEPPADVAERDTLLATGQRARIRRLLQLRGDQGATISDIVMQLHIPGNKAFMRTQELVIDGKAESYGTEPVRYYEAGMGPDSRGAHEGN